VSALVFDQGSHLVVAVQAAGTSPDARDELPHKSRLNPSVKARCRELFASWIGRSVSDRSGDRSPV
jgi:hypothetical protein